MKWVDGFVSCNDCTALKAANKSDKERDDAKSEGGSMCLLQVQSLIMYQGDNLVKKRMGTSTPSTAECWNLRVDEANESLTMIALLRGPPQNVRSAVPLSNRARLNPGTRKGVISQGQQKLLLQPCPVPEVAPPR